jgi:periplasmic protein TonB
MAGAALRVAGGGYGPGEGQGYGPPPWASFRVPSLPWAEASDDDRRFWRIATTVLLLALALGVVVPLLPLQPAPRIEAQALPAPLTKLLLERQAAVPPPVAQPVPPAVKDGAKEAPKDVAKDAAKPTPAAAAKPLNKAAPQAKTAEVSTPATPTTPAAPAEARPSAEVALADARRTASSVGLLALKDQLADITRAPAAPAIKQDLPAASNAAPGPAAGPATGSGNGPAADNAATTRALITSNATRGSGGINTAATSADASGAGGTGGAGGLAGGLGTRGGSTAVVAKAGAGTGVGASNSNAVQKSSAGSAKASRSIEDVKLVFDRNKGAIYAIYNRALRDDPALQGKVVLELKIAPGGQVDTLRIVSSELKAEELERKLVARIRQFDFGAKEVEPLVVTWPLDFLPS